jgi:enamine deaminase RidA (YjgF/YER057c/UK114 family)
MRMLGLMVMVWTLAAPHAALAKKKKSDEERPTQVLQLPKDPPIAIVAETSRLVFHVTPLSAKGLLSAQVRETLKALPRITGGATIVKLRAFVAGSGDLRRVQAIVSETFAEHHWPLPVLSVVQVGGLPLEGAQVVFESISMAKKEVNPSGLIFLAGQQVTGPGPLDPVAPLAEKSLAGLHTAVAAAGADAGDVLRGTCFLSSLGDLAKVRAQVAANFPAAAWNFVQIQRAPARAIVECEAVARGRAAGGTPLEFLNPEGLTKSPNYSQLARVTAPRIALTGTQVAFGIQEADAKLAFSRLEKELAQVGASLKYTAMSSVYPLSEASANLVRKVRFEYLDQTRPPASTMLLFEGLPSMDASFAVDVVAVVK